MAGRTQRRKRESLRRRRNPESEVVWRDGMSSNRVEQALVKVGNKHFILSVSKRFKDARIYAATPYSGFGDYLSRKREVGGGPSMGWSFEDWITHTERIAEKYSDREWLELFLYDGRDHLFTEEEKSLYMDEELEEQLEESARNRREENIKHYLRVLGWR